MKTANVITFGGPLSWREIQLRLAELAAIPGFEPGF